MRPSAKPLCCLQANGGGLATARPTLSRRLPLPQEQHTVVIRAHAVADRTTHSGAFAPFDCRSTGLGMGQYCTHKAKLLRAFCRIINQQHLVRHRDSAHDRQHAAGVQNPCHRYDVAQSLCLL